MRSDRAQLALFINGFDQLAWSANARAATAAGALIGGGQKVAFSRHPDWTRLSPPALDTEHSCGGTSAP